MVLFDPEKAIREIQVGAPILSALMGFEYMLGALIWADFNAANWDIAVRSLLALAWGFTLVIYLMMRSETR